jgi:4-diphosphocytidyl-2-C-methyl-D-erythritol kinase
MQIRSYAKINLLLRILGRRRDGYHNLLSLFQRIDLWDELSYEPLAGRIEVESDSPELPSGPFNLAFRAAEILASQAGRNAGVRIRIAKRIPVGAGLGGGSSNAGTTLIALNRLWNLGLSARELANIGKTIGSDVPFFCHEISAAWVAGRGERVTPARVRFDAWYLLVSPGFSISTAEAYRLWDESPEADKKKLTKGIDKYTISSFQTLTRRALYSRLGNDFDEVIFRRYPVFSDLRKEMTALGAKKVMLSGSGSTLFGVFLDKREVQRAETRFQRDHPGSGRVFLVGAI